MSQLCNRVRALALAGTFALVALLGGGALVATAATATPQYTLKTFSSGPGSTKFLSINENGDIVGTGGGDAAAPTENGFLLKSGATKPVFLESAEKFEGKPDFDEPFSINNSDLIVGQSFGEEPVFGDVATTWHGSSAPFRFGLFTEEEEDSAHNVNNNGEVVGSSARGAWVIGTTEKTTSVTKFLPALASGKGDDAQAINASGLIVGDSETSAGTTVAAEWKAGNISSLGALPKGGLAAALGVNSAGEAVGISTTEEGDFAERHAVLYANGKVTRITVPGETGESFANAINAKGTIIGEAAFGDEEHAFIVQNGTATDLNKLIASGSGVTLVSAAAINEKGVIVGTATKNEELVGFELTPTS
jgi:probable HAF family extracellular repeat protein